MYKLIYSFIGWTNLKTSVLSTWPSSFTYGLDCVKIPSITQRFMFPNHLTFIMLIILCNEHTWKPHFIWGKVGFAGVHVIFYFLSCFIFLFFVFLFYCFYFGSKHRLATLLRNARWGGSYERPPSMFGAKIRKIQWNSAIKTT